MTVLLLKTKQINEFQKKPELLTNCSFISAILTPPQVYWLKHFCYLDKCLLSKHLWLQQSGLGPIGTYLLKSKLEWERCNCVVDVDGSVLTWPLPSLRPPSSRHRLVFLPSCPPRQTIRHASLEISSVPISISRLQRQPTGSTGSRTRPHSLSQPAKSIEE